jgi:hypothetical protein
LPPQLCHSCRLAPATHLPLSATSFRTPSFIAVAINQQMLNATLDLP